MLTPEEKVALTTIKNVAEFIKNCNQPPSNTYNKKNAFAMQLLLITLAEAARIISKPIKDMYKSMPWAALGELRTSASKRWHSLDLQILFQDAMADIPALAKSAAAILKEENNAMAAFHGNFMVAFFADEQSKLKIYRQKQKKQKVINPLVTTNELIETPYTQNLKTLGRILEQITNIEEFLQDDPQMQSPLTIYAIGMAMTIIGLCVEMKIDLKFKSGYPLDIPITVDPLANITWNKLESNRKHFMHEGYDIQFHLVFNSAYFYINKLKGAIQTIENSLRKEITWKKKTLIYIYETEDFYRLGKKLLEKERNVSLLKPAQGGFFVGIAIESGLVSGKEFFQTSNSYTTLMLIKLTAYDFVTVMVKANVDKEKKEKVAIFAIISSTIDHQPDLTELTAAVNRIYPQVQINLFPQLQKLTQIIERDIHIILMTNLTDLVSGKVDFATSVGLTFIEPMRLDIEIVKKRLLHQETSMGFLAKQVITLNAWVWAKAWAQIALWLKLGVTDAVMVNKLIPHILNYIFPQELATSSEVEAGKLVEIKGTARLIRGFANTFFSKANGNSMLEKIEQKLQQQKQMDASTVNKSSVEMYK